MNDLYRDRRIAYTVRLLGSVPRLKMPRRAPGWCRYQVRPRRWRAWRRLPVRTRCPLVIIDPTAERVLDVATDHRAACIRTGSAQCGRSAADVYRVKTEARPAALGDASVVVRVRHLVGLPAGQEAWCCAGRSAGRAVDGIESRTPGLTLGIVGESGSGKIDHPARDPGAGCAAIGIDRSPRH